MADRVRVRLPGVELPPADALQAIAALERVDLRAHAQRHVRAVLDSLDEIARHAVREAGTAHEHVDLRAALREKDGGLAGGVAAPDDRDRLAFAQLGFEVRRAVHDAGALEA